jgi:hypothetical protein
LVTCRADALPPVKKTPRREVTWGKFFSTRAAR